MNDKIEAAYKLILEQVDRLVPNSTEGEEGMDYDPHGPYLDIEDFQWAVMGLLEEIERLKSNDAN